MNSCLGSPDEGVVVNLSVGMQRCPDGALERGILVKPGANLISYPPAPGKIKHSLPGVISKIAFFSDMLLRPSSAGRSSPAPSTMGHSNFCITVP